MGVVGQTFAIEDRLNNLQQCTTLLQLTMPAVIDSDDNIVNRTYGAWPDRLYAIDINGKVGFKSGPGPAGFKTPDLAVWIQKNVK